MLRVALQTAAQQPPRDANGVEAGGNAAQSGSSCNTAAMMSAGCHASKRRPSRQHFIEHATERPDVSPLVDRMTPGLFRTHKNRSAEDHAGLTSPRAGAATLPAGATGGHETVGGLSPTQSPEPSRHRQSWDLDVSGFQIAMNDVLVVRGFQRVGDLPRGLECLVDRDRSAAGWRSAKVSPSTSSSTSARYAGPRPRLRAGFPPQRRWRRCADG